MSEKITIKKNGRDWYLTIPVSFAHHPSDAFEGWHPGANVDDLNIIDMFGLTTWDTGYEAIKALNEWSSKYFSTQKCNGCSVPLSIYEVEDGMGLCEDCQPRVDDAYEEYYGAQMERIHLG